MNNKIKEELIKNPNRSNTAIAKEILGNDAKHNEVETLRQKIGRFRKRVNEWGKEFEIKKIEETFKQAWVNSNKKLADSIWATTYTREFPSAPLPEDEVIPDNFRHKVGIKESNNTLVIADLHIPFEKEGYFEHCCKLYEEWNCNKVVFIGDEIDSNSISFHPKNPDLYSPKDELELSKSKLRRWYNMFPNAVVINGNHTNLIKRKIADAGLPSQVMRPLNEILGVNNWTYLDKYLYNGILYIHGTGLSTTSVEKKVMYSQYPVVMGHLHSTSRIQYYTQDLYSVIIGCGCDETALAFEYNRNNPKPSIVSTLIVKDKTPILIPM